MPSLRISLSIKSFVSGIRAFFNAYKKRVIADGGVVEGENCAIDKLKNPLLNSASLVLIPSGVKATKVYSERPTNGTGDFTFARASTATRTNASGLIEAVASNVPRLDYSGGATCPRLLLEPQRTNVALDSETFAAGTGTTIVLNNTASPDGYVSADKLVEDTSTGVHITVIGGALGGTVDSSAYSVSVFAKAAGRTRINMFDNGQSGAGAAPTNFDIQNGIVISGTGKIENYGNGWYRCIIFPAKTASTNSNVQIRLIDTGTNISYTGNGTSGVFLWGKQVEAGTFASSYIPTTTAAVTRLADLASKTGVSSLIGQTEGTMFFGFNLTRYNDTKTLGSIDVGDITNFITITINAGIPRLTVRQSGTSTQLFFSTQLAFGNHKLAVGYKSGDYVMYINGTQVGTSSSTIYPVGTLTRYVLSNSQYGDLADSYNQAALFPTRLTNAQLAQMTTL